MDAITTALLQRYGGASARQSPLLLNPAPALAGLPPGAAIQTNTPQPILPQPGVPAAPRNNQPNNTAMNLLSSIRSQQDRMGSGQGGGQGMQSPMLGGGGMQGFLNATGFNPAYYANKLFGMGQSAVTPFNLTPSIGMSDISLPNIGSLLG